VLARPEIICLTNGVFAENCYIVADRGAGEAVLVDPGEEAGLFLARLRSEELRLTAIWLTHAHLDHVSGIGAVKAEWDVPVWLHPADRPLYDRTPEQARGLGEAATSLDLLRCSDECEVHALRSTVEGRMAVRTRAPCLDRDYGLATRRN